MTTSVQKPIGDQGPLGADILELQEIVRKVPIADHVSRYAVRLDPHDPPREG